MEKLFKITAIAIMFVVITGTMSSCLKEYKKQVVYRAGWADYSLTLTEMGSVEDYLTTKGALQINGYKIYTVTSNKDENDCYEQSDAMARTDFANATQNLKVEEAQSLLEPGSFFIYNWTRTDDADNKVEIGRWECPAKPVPSEFGKLNVNDVDYTVISAIKLGAAIGGSPATAMYLRADEAAFMVTISGLEQAGIIPEGHFDVDNVHNKGVLSVGDKMYHTTGTSCKIAKNGDFYKFESSGTATDDDGNSVEFSLNCNQVLFKN